MFAITPLQKEPENKVYVHAYDVESGTLDSGEKIRVQVKTGGEWVDLMDEQVPNGKNWKEIHFQFQAVELEN
jgi:hypothetical protein